AALPISARSRRQRSVGASAPPRSTRRHTPGARPEGEGNITRCSRRKNGSKLSVFFPKNLVFGVWSSPGKTVCSVRGPCAPGTTYALRPRKIRPRECRTDPWPVRRYAFGAGHHLENCGSRRRVSADGLQSVERTRGRCFRYPCTRGGAHPPPRLPTPSRTGQRPIGH